MHFCRPITLALTALVLSASVSAQSFDQIREQMRQGFDDQKASRQNEFREYRDKVNAEFARCLGRPWKEVQREEPKKEEGFEDLPDSVTFTISGSETVIKKSYVISASVPVPAPQPQPIVPIEFEQKTDQISLYLAYFNSPCSIHFNPSKRPVLSDITETSVMEMWQQLSSEDCDNLISDCLNIRERLSLCDWGYLKLTESVADLIYESPDESNSATVLQAYLMNQSGYKIRLGHDSQDKIYLLIATADDIIGKSYWPFQGSRYYLAEDSEVDALYMVKASFPGEKSIRLTVDEPQNLELDLSPQRPLQSKRYEEASTVASVNENQMEFWSVYPTPYRNSTPRTSWAYYANTPISPAVQDIFYPGLLSSIQGKEQLEALNVLLNFVQTAFTYKADSEVWGEERAFFPEETLFYEYSDCEDRAILFSRIVRDLLGLEVLLVHYPNHLATAVALDVDCPGDKLIYNDKKYTICDPTFINAFVGATMDGCDNATANIIVL